MDQNITQANQSTSQNNSQPVVPDLNDLMKRDRLFITIKSPDATLFNGEATALSSLNDVGPFDVLPRHENFISILNSKIVIFIDKNQKQELPIDKGIIKARQNRVQIFLGIETLGKTDQKVFTQGQVANASEAIEKDVVPEKKT